MVRGVKYNEDLPRVGRNIARWFRKGVSEAASISYLFRYSNGFDFLGEYFRGYFIPYYLKGGRKLKRRIENNLDRLVNKFESNEFDLDLTVETAELIDKYNYLPGEQLALFSLCDLAAYLIRVAQHNQPGYNSSKAKELLDKSDSILRGF